jgi:hypothetical protein
MHITYRGGLPLVDSSSESTHHVNLRSSSSVCFTATLYKSPSSTYPPAQRTNSTDYRGIQGGTNNAVVHRQLYTSGQNVEQQVPRMESASLRLSRVICMRFVMLVCLHGCILANLLTAKAPTCMCTHPADHAHLCW